MNMNCNYYFSIIMRTKRDVNTSKYTVASVSKDITSAKTIPTSSKNPVQK